MGSVNAGTLNHRVTLQHPATEPNGQGGFRPTGQASETVYASVTAAKGSEAYRLGQQLQTTIYQVRIRYRKAMVVPELISWQGKTLRVVQRLQSFEQVPEYVDLLAVDSGQSGSS